MSDLQHFICCAGTQRVQSSTTDIQILSEADPHGFIQQSFPHLGLSPREKYAPVSHVLY